MRQRGLLAGAVLLASAGIAGAVYALCPPFPDGEPAALAKGAQRFAAAAAHPNELRCAALAVALSAFGLLLLRSIRWARPAPAGDAACRRLRTTQGLYLLGVSAIGVALFGFGADAAGYLNGQIAQWGLLSVSAYGALLAAAIGCALLALLLRRLSRQPFGRCASYAGAVFAGFVAFFALASFPSPGFIYPFFFNLLLSVLVALVGAAPLGLLPTSEPDAPA